MRIGNLHIEIEKNYASRKDFRYFCIEFIPGIAFRYVKANFGKEYNLYMSWFLWVLSITYQKRNESR